MTGSRGESGISTSDLAVRFLREAETWRRERGLVLRLARVTGRRWAHLAGPRPDPAVPGAAVRVRLTPDLGVLVAGGPVPEGFAPGLRRALLPLPAAPPGRAGLLAAVEARAWRDVAPRADAVRRDVFGEDVFVRAIVEFSNVCRQDCLYCGLRRGNAKLERYRMTRAEIVEAVGRIAADGIKTAVLQSGDDLSYAAEEVCAIVAEIRARFPGMAVTLSIGERPDAEYEAFRRAGADRFLIKHETAVPSLYARLHPGQSHERRMEILRRLRALGYQTGTGFIVGLPGQTAADIVEDLLFIGSFKPEMAGIGPFVPQKDTPLGTAAGGSVDAALTAVALARILSPRTMMPATTALATAAPGRGMAMALAAGANAIMLDYTPERYRVRYRIYDDKVRLTPGEAARAAEDVGLRLSFSRGDAGPYSSG